MPEQNPSPAIISFPNDGDYDYHNTWQDSRIRKLMNDFLKKSPGCAFSKEQPAGRICCYNDIVKTVPPHTTNKKKFL